MTPERWLEAASADADRRGLPDLKPLLETLARSTAALREHERELEREQRPGAEPAGRKPAP
jgi:hypothetical protein